MLGLMRQKNLLPPSIIQHAARWHPDAEIVSRTSETNRHRSDYATIECRSGRLADVPQRLDVNQGDRVAAMAWNGCR
jgi:acyl-CoA synthetase (AMP-forming)/AMP-acid ligase II